MNRIIIALVCLNAALAGYFAYAVVRRPVAAEVPEEETTAVDSGKSSSPSSRRTFAFIRPANKNTQRAFGWDALASTDLNQYVANLRAVNCPEQTIRDIIQAEVNRRYGSLERALKVRPEDVPPWETPATFNRKTAEGKLRQLLEEKRAMLKELVGIDVPVDMPSRLGGRDITKFESAYKELPPDKQEQVRAIQEKYWSQSDDIKARTVGFLENEDREEFVRIKAERRAELAKVLSPREIEDYEMRTSTAAATLNARMDGFAATDEEKRKIFNFLQPLDEEFSLGRRSPDPENKEFTEQRTKAEQAVNDQIRTVLGEERYAEYQRTRDADYRNLASATKDMGLPPESLVQMYETQKAIKTETQRLARDLTLTPEQRVQSQMALQMQAQQAMQTIFGERAPEIMTKLGASGQPVMDPALARRYGIPTGAQPQVVPQDTQIIRQ